MTTTAKTSPFGLLLNKSSETLSEGAFHRHASIEKRDRTRHEFAQVDVAARGDLAKVASPLGLGYLQAVLAVLHLVPVHVSYDAPGLVGRLEAKGRDMYHLSWNESDGVECQQGGFIYEGKPNYYSAMLGLVQCIAMYLSGERLQSQEVFTAWCTLLGAMESAFPRSSGKWGWSERDIADACLRDSTRRPILHVCDTLRAAMQYHLAARSRREVSVYQFAVVEPDEGTAISVDAYRLLDADWLMATAASVSPLPTPHAVSEAETEKASSSPSPSGTPGKTSPSKRRSSSPTTPSSMTTGSPVPASASPSSTPATPSPLAAAVSAAPPVATTPSASALYGPYLDQIQMALHQGGALMLVGPTGTGKSSLLLDAARGLKWGVELVVCHKGKRIHVLQGGHTRDVEKGDGNWCFSAGPIVRLAKRIAAGEKVMFILDELARAHEEVFDYIMDLLNTYSSREVESMIPKKTGDDMQLTLPPDFGKDEQVRYHLLDVHVLLRRFVVPTSHLLIAATANQGDRYGGLTFDDPAFCRRFTHWLHLAKYDDTVIRQILADKCGLPTSSPLIGAILQVEKEVHTYHEREDVLKMTLALPLLINWARQVIWYYSDPASSYRGNLKKSFEVAARSSWLARVCPYKGAELDPEVERDLLGYVTKASLPRLR